MYVKRPFDCIGLALTSCSLLAAANGCSVDAAPSPEPAAQTSNKLGKSPARVVLGTQYDWSNSMSVTLYQCDWTGPNVGDENVASCSVPDEEMAVGGGAEIENEGDPGAVLTGSYPSAAFDSWGVSSGAPGSSPPYRLRAYALGLRLVGVSGPALRAMARRKQEFSAHTNRPSVTVSVDDGDWTMVGGGGYASYGQYLTHSYAPDATSWTVGSKDHHAVDVGYVSASLIQVPTCPENYVGLCLNRGPHWNGGSWVQTGYATNIIAGNQGGYVTTSIGAEANYNGDGRMLTDMFPTYFFGQIIAVARSKDHFYADSGTTWAITFNVQQD